MSPRPVSRSLRATIAVVITSSLLACDRHDTTSPLSGTPALVVDAYEVLPVPANLQRVLASLRRGEVPPGVKTQPVRSSEDRPGSAALAYSSTEECDIDEDCMVVWDQPELNPTSDEIMGGAYFLTSIQAKIATATTGWLTREGYNWGRDEVPILKAKTGTNTATFSGTWGGTCGAGRYNRIHGITRAVAEYNHVFPPVLETWGPANHPYDEVCNPDMQGRVTEDLCNGEPETSVAPLKPSFDCDPNSTTNGGGGQDLRCGWYTYEISFDGGATWSPVGETFEICEEIQGMTNVAPASTNGATASRGPTPVRLPVTILGKGELRDAPHAFIYRDMKSDGVPVIAVDTTIAKPGALEAAFLALGEIRDFTTDSRVTHARIVVGDYRLGDAAKIRAATRGRQFLSEVRSAPEAAISGIAKGRALHVTIDRLNTSRHPLP
jgi:hypothetical protein